MPKSRNAIANTGLTGAVSATRWAGGTADVAPTTGTFVTGDFVISLTGKIWICTSGGTPGTWTQVGGGASFPLDYTAASAGTDVMTIDVTSDSQLRFVINADGSMEWGDGTSALDTKLFRGGANVLSLVNDQLSVSDGTTGYVYLNPSGSIGTYGNAVGSSSLSATVTGEAYSRFGIAANGGMGWGPGTTNHDVGWFRFAANTVGTSGLILATDNLSARAIYLNGPAGIIGTYNVTSTTFDLSSTVIGEGNARFAKRIDGLMQWGPGSTAADVNLYRAGVNQLKTDDALIVGLNGTYAGGTAGEINLGGVGPGSVAAILFGSALDTNLFRSAANTLKTDDAFHAVGGVRADSLVQIFGASGSAHALYLNVPGDTHGRTVLTPDGTIGWGTGFADIDTNLYRAGVDQLKTDSAFGIGTNPGSLLHVSAGGVTPTLTAADVLVVQRNAAAGNQASIIVASGNTGIAALYFGDAEDKAQGRVYYDNATEELAFSTSGTRRVILDASWLAMNPASGPALRNATSTATLPTLVPHRSATTTGVGGVSGTVSLITAGAERVRVEDALLTSLVPFVGLTLSPTGMSGATLASRYVGATATSYPASGTWAVGDWVVSQNGAIWICTVAGSQGTWIQAGNTLISDTPYNATSWNSQTEIAPSKNAVRDEMENRAPLASPALSGTPTAPTAGAGTNTTQIATTAYAFALVSDTAYNAGTWDAVTGIAPSKNAVRDQFELKANLASPALTGTPTAPTAAAGTNTTQIATTAYAIGVPDDTELMTWMNGI